MDSDSSWRKKKKTLTIESVDQKAQIFKSACLGVKNTFLVETGVVGIKGVDYQGYLAESSGMGKDSLPLVWGLLGTLLFCH